MHPENDRGGPLSHAGPGLYLHIPFCSEVCPYCDFAVVKASSPRREAFVDMLLREMGFVAGEGVAGGALAGEGAVFDTIYLGGGTPSILPPEALGRLLRGAREVLGASPEAWVFLEANPEDVSRESLAAWRGLGVRTLSLGVQSFDPRELAFLGRRHTARVARQAVELAREAGFSTVSVDLIYGLPGQGPESWRRNLETAVALGPEHLSCYQLTIEEGTPFGVRRARGELPELGEDRQAELFALTHAFLADSGYPAYEVSNFASAPEHRSRHNRKYWHHTPYLGLGPSAHSFDGGRRRFWNERRLHLYQERLRAGERPILGSEELSDQELALETVMLGLRTTEGVDLARFRERFALDLVELNAPFVEAAVAGGLLTLGATHLTPTLAGLAVAEALAGKVRLGMEPPATAPTPAGR